MSSELSDTLFGVAVLAVFLVIVFGMGFLIYKFKNAGFAKAWQPLIPLIDGKIEDDGGGGASSWLIGRYKGKSVYAQMIPKRNLYPGETGSYYNYFETGLRQIPGVDSWKVEYKAGVLGLGHKGWVITTDNKALEQALQNAGILDLITPFHPLYVTYDRGTDRLSFSSDITPLLVPSNERVQQELELLLQLAQINQQVNSK